ncbi:hypothetical protein MLD38_029899 [Melastoma candidum]|uniref:Uncharacterized protein n=1 Tax=Melastoma candidum TaxID=119954 RepID=A0ACB9MKC8_9MYRT|nr:hypothetical protein MLD38_029899 [Melastoma candidum]
MLNGKELIVREIVNHFTILYGASPVPARDDYQEGLQSLVRTRISCVQGEMLSRPVGHDEIIRALSSLKKSKAPGPDGFPPEFFLGSWKLLCRDVIEAITEFFAKGRMLKQWNVSAITLVPKSKNAMRVSDYRPISCCNTMYKCISKVLADRLKMVIGVLVGPTQSAFIPGRKIVDNIMLAQEIIHGYGAKRGPKGCVMQMDIAKAFDSLEWPFIRSALRAFDFPNTFITWVMECISTPTSSVNINGELHGFIKHSRGLRQGDPLSPYLFVLSMEMLSLQLNLATQLPCFKKH